MGSHACTSSEALHRPRKCHLLIVLFLLLAQWKVITEDPGCAMSDLIEALNLITSSKIHELYSRQDTEDPLVLRKKVCSITASHSPLYSTSNLLSKCRTDDAVKYARGAWTLGEKPVSTCNSTCCTILVILTKTGGCRGSGDRVNHHSRFRQCFLVS